MLTRFLYEAADASLIDWVPAAADPELAARNQERARDSEDEKHVHPLQLDVIDRQAAAVGKRDLMETLEINFDEVME